MSGRTKRNRVLIVDDEENISKVVKNDFWSTRDILFMKRRELSIFRE